MKMDSPTVVDLFGAPGGMSEGFRQAGFKILAAIDNFSWGCETLKHNHPSTLVLDEDVTRIDFHELKNKIDGTGISVLTGGPPCQGVSIVGRPKIASLNGGNNFNDSRNDMYKIFLKAVKIFKPEFFVMENVQGILNFQNGRIKNDILETGRKMGYHVDFRTLNAADYGVPQYRKRVFFIGNRLELDDDIFPTLTHNGKNGDKINGKLKPCVTLQDAISDLPRLRSGNGKDEVEYKSSPRTPYQRKMRKKSKELYNHVARPHNKRDLDIFKLVRKGVKYFELPENLKPYRDDIFKDKYRALSSGRPSSTIVAHLSKDGLGFIHPRQNRSITVREASRLQSFPDRFRFMGPRTYQFMQVGNAVPPLLANAIALKLKSFL